MALEDLTPAVRLEGILDGQDIEPATRLEYFLKKAAEGAGGSSGAENSLKYYTTEELLSTPIPVISDIDGSTVMYNGGEHVSVPGGLVMLTDRAYPFCVLYPKPNGVMCEYTEFVAAGDITPFTPPVGADRNPGFYVKTVSSPQAFNTANLENFFVKADTVTLGYGYTVRLG